MAHLCPKKSLSYPRVYNEDTNTPFIISINLDVHYQDNQNIEILKQSAGKRIQHIRVKGSRAKGQNYSDLRKNV